MNKSKNYEKQRGRGSMIMRKCITHKKKKTFDNSNFCDEDVQIFVRVFFCTYSKIDLG